MSKQTKGNLMILLAAFIWGTAFLAQKDGGRIGTFTFNGIRNLIGGISLLPVIYVLDKLRAKAARTKTARTKAAENSGSEDNSGTITDESGAVTDENGAVTDENSAITDENGIDLSWNCTVFMGGITLGVILFIASSLQQYGLLFTTIGKVGFITALYSLIVPIISVVLGKKVPKLTWAGVFIGVIGLYLLSMHGESFHLAYGDTIVLGCAFAFSIQIMLIDHFAPKVDGVKLACVEFLTVGVISLFFMFTFEEPSLEALGTILPSLIYAGFFSSGVAYTLQIVGQRGANPTQASLMMCLESVFALLTGAIVLHERMLPVEYVGAALIFTAVVLAQIPDKPKEKLPAAPQDNQA